MKYNVNELIEANGADYKLGMTPKRMLVWNSDSCNDVTVHREVLGFFQGRWIAAAVIGTGVCEWNHAAEIPTQTVRPFKNVQEFVDAAGGLGAIWLRQKAWGGRYTSLVASIDYSDHTVQPIWIDSRWLSFRELLEDYTFTDGRQCGVEE